MSNHRTASNYIPNNEEAEMEKNDNLSNYFTIPNVLGFLLQSLNCLSALIFPHLFVFGLYLSCKEKDTCSFLILPEIPPNFDFIDGRTLTCVIAWFFFQCILANLPIGRISFGPALAKQAKNVVYYRLNGLHGMIINLIVFGILVYNKQFPFDIINTRYLNLINATYLLVFWFSTLTFLLSLDGGEAEPSEGLIQDFVFGRITTPQLYIGANFTFDMKTFAFKTGFITWGIFNLVYLINVWDQKLESNASLIFLVVFQLWYILHHMIFEEANLYTASLASEKKGFVGWSVMILLWSLFCPLQAKYLSLHPRSLPWYQYIAPLFLQVIGYWIYYSSTLAKFYFRKDPEKAKLSGALFISTDKGTDLLISGWWGILRHPNYFGDLLMNISWAWLCGFSHLLPWIWAISLTFMLISMALRDDSVCKKKYGKSWEEYKEKVKYVVIPYIY